MSISRTQDWTAASTNGAATVAKAYAVDVTAGSLLTAFLATTDSGTPAFSDDKGNSWQIAVGPIDGASSGNFLMIAYAMNAAAGATTITATASAGTPASVLGIAEYAGAKTASAIDGTSSSTSSLDPGAIATTVQGLVLGALAVTSFTNGTAATGFSRRSGTNNFVIGNGSVEDRITSAAGSYDPAWSAGGSAPVSVGAAFAAFIPAGVRSMAMFWMGGAGNKGVPCGYRSMLAYWMGGAASFGVAPTDRARDRQCMRNVGRFMGT